MNITPEPWTCLEVETSNGDPNNFGAGKALEEGINVHPDPDAASREAGQYNGISFRKAVISHQGINDAIKYEGSGKVEPPGRGRWRQGLRSKNVTALSS